MIDGLCVLKIHFWILAFNADDFVGNIFNLTNFHISKWFFLCVLSNAFVFNFFDKKIGRILT